MGYTGTTDLVLVVFSLQCSLVDQSIGDTKDQRAPPDNLAIRSYSHNVFIRNACLAEYDSKCEVEKSELTFRVGVAIFDGST